MAQQQPPRHMALGRRASRDTPENTKGGRRTERHDADSPPEAHVYRSGGTLYRCCRPRRSPFTTAVTLGAVLVGAAAVSSGSRNPPPPPPPPPSLGTQYNQNNGRQQDRWVGWTPPPPGPPPDPSASGSGGEEAKMVWGTGAQGSSPQGGASNQGTGAVCEDGSSSSGPGIGMGHSQQPQQYHDAAAGAMETQQQLQERMSRTRQQQGRPGPPPPPTNSQQQQQFPLQQQQQQQQQQRPSPPHSWGQNGAQQQDEQQDPPYDGAYSNGRNARVRPGFTVPESGGIFQQPPAAAGMGMVGGAGAGANGGGGGAVGSSGGSGGQWEPPSAASAGAVTPEVKRWGLLGCYRARTTEKQLP